MGRPRKGKRIRGPYEDKSRGRWRVDAFAEGADKPRSSYFESELEAEQFADGLEADLESRARTTEEAILQYKRYLKDKGNGTASNATTLWALGEFFRVPEVLADLTTSRCEDLYKDLRTRPKRTQVDGKWIRPETGEPMSADSHRGILKQAKSFLRWCVAEGFMNSNPAEGVKPIGRLRPRGKSLGKSGVRIRIREARALYYKAIELAPANTHAAVALTAILLGLRASEIVRLRVRDLDSDQVDGDVLHVEERKNGEDLELEVPVVLRPLLLARTEGREPDAFLFAHQKGKPYRRWYVRESVHKVCAAAGVPAITAHACRGLLATVAAERGMAGHLIAATLGNGEQVMAGHYAAPGALESGGRRRGLAVLQGGKAVI